MALGKRRAVTGPPPDSRFVVLASLIAKETIPSLREILDLGKELHVARLTHFIPTAFSGTNPQARTRNLLYDAALLNELKTAREVTETRSRLHEQLIQITKDEFWLYIRDEVSKFSNKVIDEVESRQSKLSTSKISGLNATQAAVLNMISAIPPGKGIDGKTIISELKKLEIYIESSTFRSHVIKKLKEDHGVTNHRAAGGYLIATSQEPM